MLIVRMEGGQLWFSRAKEQRRTCQTCKYVFSQKGYQKTKGRCIQLETQYHRESLPAHHVLGAEGLNPLSASSSQRKNLLACFHCLLRYPLGTAEACCRATLVFDLHPLPPSWQVSRMELKAPCCHSWAPSSTLKTKTHPLLQLCWVII